MKRINVTNCYLPPMEEYVKRIESIWETHHLTNYGPLNIEFVEKLEKYLELKNIHYVTNGTIALQVAIKALKLEPGEIITTPFTFIASTSSISWEGYTPVFVDIEDKTFGIDVTKIEEKITDKTRAILAVHCYGYPCNVEALEKIGKKYNIPIIYDAAHAFGSRYKGKPLFKYGDISTASLHATKVFHSIEGGLVVVNNDKYNKTVNAIKNFGYENAVTKDVGINAKNSEFHAAMGLCVFDHLDEIIAKRKEVSDTYRKLLNDYVTIPQIPKELEYNYIYFPVLFKNEKELLKVTEQLEKNNIFIRRYFYPSINTLGLFGKGSCPVSEDISSRIACLPLDTYLEKKDIELISKIIIESIKKS